MATTKETMNVIANGIGRGEPMEERIIIQLDVPMDAVAMIGDLMKSGLVEEDDCEVNDAEQLSRELAESLVERTVSNFMSMVGSLSEEEISQGLVVLYQSNAEEAVNMIRGMFITSGMCYAADDLKLLMLCRPYDELIYEIFMEEFFTSEEVSWFLADDVDEEGEDCGEM